MTSADEDAAVARLRRWGAEPSGTPWRTPSSLLVPGARDGVPVVLKVALVDEERRGGLLMAWWAGRGAVPVLAHDAEAVLLVRATGARDLAAMARAGRDAEATAVLVDAALALHRHPLPPATVPLVPLRRWFRDLVDRPWSDPVLARAATIARELLDSTSDEDVVALHGDVHHGNVLDLGDGWAAIDPKGLVGHRAFDFANLFCNPDAATALAHLDERLAIVADRTGLPVRTLIAWTVAWCALSTVWGEAEPAWWSGGATRALAAALLPRV